MTFQGENVGADTALIEPEQKQNQVTEPGINLLDNPFSQVSSEDCPQIMQTLIDDPAVSLEELKLRVLQLNTVNCRGYNICWEKGVLPYNNGVN